ncbi:hypothetical protein E6C76_20235 [Pseudothauera nasutitermitis]|uniref:Uncharacterized protein n=1 Tax=Pseudothauera nasutitermitis TaxID=2565930 RepID=A0A4S4AQ78_9RHOO|nr:hypothetical protein [Pseudothauera nasutitermitis]THF61412.1 hypothetical protein E6C76_20235 [Pseudothauera nasutitermitis]
MATTTQGASAPTRTAAERPLIERRSFPPRTAPLTDLDFVADVRIERKTRRSFWAVPQTDDYGHANNVGRQYACDFVQWLKDNPRSAGSNLLGWVVKDMAEVEEAAAAKGYAVGFWCFIELLLLQAANRIDHYALAEADAQRYAAILAMPEDGESDHAA